MHGDSKWLSALNDQRSCRLPASNDLVEDEVVVEEPPTASKGKLIDRATLERIANIEVRIRIVGRRIEGALIILGARTAALSRRVDIAHEMRPDVIEVEVQTVAEPFLDRGLKRVVVGLGVVRAPENMTVLRIRSQLLAVG